MFNKTHHQETYRSTPNRVTPVSPARIQELLEIERAKFSLQAPKSGVENRRAAVTPLGVASSFQHWDPYPISIVSAKGAWMKDVDGREMLDLSMGFGALLVGHLNEEVIKEAHATLDVGTLFATPSPITRDGAEIICRRFGLDMVRFANSGTEATMYALRTARAATGKLGIIKIEGGYHGSTVPGDVWVVPYNDADAIERVLKKDADKIACVFMEPVLENIGIVLPDMGYLERVRELCDQYGVLLVFDEVKTGLTAGPQGAAQRLGVKPDLIALAKSIGGGIPVAAFGGKREYMEVVVNGRHTHLGTFNGHYLAMAGIRAVDRLCTPEALKRSEDLNRQALTRISEIINEYEIPAHTVGFGVKGCITWSPSPVRNYRDYKATDFDIAELSFFWSLNRNVMTPPGLDEQWLISLAHGQREIDIIVGDFLEFAQALRA
jgi:glutamate-1-semialdehyde 2,1-aminomutase